jgi:maleylpyruvate isomerase
MQDALRRLAEAESRVQWTVAVMTDDEAAGPSGLPGWDRAMVVTHLARNADGNAQMIAAKLKGEDRPQYPHGPRGRAEDIEKGRGRSAEDLAADLAGAAARLALVLGQVDDDDWDLVVPAGVGPRPIRQRVGGREVEVEVHHADLALAYSWADWPAELVARELPQRAGSLGGGTPDAPSGSWTMRTGDQVWTVTTGSGSGATGEVSGAPAGLYAWLIGRASAADAGLTLTGDERVADLPGWFPWS